MSDIPTGSPPPSGGGDIILPHRPPKNPIVVLLLNLFLAGCVGYFTIDQRNKGIVALIAFVVGFMPGLCGTVSVLVCFLAAVDGYLQAYQLEEGHPIRQWTFFNGHA